MGTWQRVLYWVQWVPVVGLPIWWFVAPGAGTGGWATVLMIVVAPLVALALAVPAVIAAALRGNRRAQATSKSYGVLAPVLWVVAWLPPTFIGGASDMRSWPSWSEHWWGISGSTAGVLLPVSAMLFVGTWVVSILAAAVPTDQPERPAEPNPKWMRS